MTEMQVSSDTPETLPKKSLDSQLNVLAQDSEDEKERTIAKATLSIAELGTSRAVRTEVHMLN